MRFCLITIGPVDLLPPIWRALRIGIGAAGIVCCLKPIVNPLANIPAHIPNPEFALSLDILINRGGTALRVAEIGEVLVDLFAPGTLPPLGFARRPLPLSLRRQALIDPVGISTSVFSGDIYHGVIGPPRGEITALPMHRRPASSRVDEVLVLQICHFEAVEIESLSLYQMFWVFVFTADQVTAQLERSDGNKNHSPFMNARYNVVKYTRKIGFATGLCVNHFLI